MSIAFQRTVVWPRWAVTELGAPTGEDIRVAVIDSGWARSIVDSRVAAGIGLVDPEDELGTLVTTDDDDRIGHGTGCADVVLRIAPAAQILPIRVFGQRLETSVPMLISALDHAVERGAHVLNLSLGTCRMEFCHEVQRACERVQRTGAILVAASNRGARSLPAVLGNVIGVEAGDSRSSAWYRCLSGTDIDCEARSRHRGVRWRGGGLRDVYGSSFAAPVLSGTIALLRERYPEVGLREIRQLLKRYEAPHPPVESSYRSGSVGR